MCSAQPSDHDQMLLNDWVNAGPTVDGPSGLLWFGSDVGDGLRIDFSFPTFKQVQLFICNSLKLHLAKRVM